MNAVDMIARCAMGQGGNYDPARPAETNARGPESGGGGPILSQTDHGVDGYRRLIEDQPMSDCLA